MTVCFLPGLFDDKPDPLLDTAADLGQGPQINVVGMFVSLLGRFPVLRQMDTEHSDFMLTVAGVFMAGSRLNNLRLGDTLEDKVMEVAAERLNEWKPDAIRGFEECKGVFEGDFDRLVAAGQVRRTRRTLVCVFFLGLVVNSVSGNVGHRWRSARGLVVKAPLVRRAATYVSDRPRP